VKRLLLALVAALAVAAPAQAATPTLEQPNCKPIEIAQGQLFHNTFVDGISDARVADVHCHNSQPFLPPHDGHRGVADVTADGQTVLLETAFGWSRNSSFASPGKGVGMRLQLFHRDTGQLDQLTGAGRKAIIWAKLRPDGGAVAWSQMTKTQLESGTLTPFGPYYLGQWRLHVADIENGALVNERSWEHPTDPGFIEAYGWVGDKIVFTSDQGINEPSQSMDWYRSQLWSIPDTLDQQPTRISPPFTYRTWCCQKTQNAYHEFVRAAPDGMFPESGPWLLFSVDWDRDVVGGNAALDMWRMRPDGSGRQRVTSFTIERYVVVSAAVTDPADPKRLIFPVLNDLGAENVDAWELRLP
jgi:hypothetical protein